MSLGYVSQPLVTYLELNATQAAQISKNDRAYAELVSTKQQRIYQVQAEIAVETAKETVDPYELGVRYREIELICRDLKQAESDLRKENSSVLTDPQKAKVAALEEAMKLVPLYQSAQGAGLVQSTPTTALRIGDFSGLALTIPNTSACSPPSRLMLDPFLPIAVPVQP